MLLAASGRLSSFGARAEEVGAIWHVALCLRLLRSWHYLAAMWIAVCNAERICRFVATNSVPLPNEAHQELVRALEELHRAAGHPGMRKVSALIAEGDYPAVVSHEGVRTTLKGLNVPRWETVQSIVAALAAACVDPPRDPTAEVARFLPLWRAVREGEPGGMKSARELALSQGWGTNDGRWTAEAVVGMMINPFNAIEIAPALAVPHEPVISEDEWVHAGVRLIEEHGAEFALRALLRTLKGDYLGAEQEAPSVTAIPTKKRSKYTRPSATAATGYSSAWRRSRTSFSGRSAPCMSTRPWTARIASRCCGPKRMFP